MSVMILAVMLLSLLEPALNYNYFKYWDNFKSAFVLYGLIFNSSPAHSMLLYFFFNFVSESIFKSSISSLLGYFSQIPIIFITALDDEDNTVKGLNIGADDYIAKPLSMKEVKARVRAVLRRFNPPSQQREVSGSTICYGEIIVDLNTKTAKLDGEELALTKLEFELLSFFLRNPDKVFSREDLLARCWPQDVYVLDRTVDVNITRLRKKIGRYGKQIKTRIGYGYCFEK